MLLSVHLLEVFARRIGELMADKKIQITASSGARDGHKILALKGPLNIHTVFDFQNAVRAESAPTLIVDFSGVPFIDSAALGALVATHLATQKANRKLAMAGLNPQVRALLDMTRVSHFFHIYPSIEDAEKAA